MPPMRTVLAAAVVLASPALAPARAADPGRPPAIDLAGEWAFRLDPGDRGLAGAWWDVPLADRIRLPGALQSQGHGDPVSVATAWTGEIVDRSWFDAPGYEPYRRPGNVKVPFWLQPERHYVGAAWYARAFEVPADWAGRRIVLILERPHWETRVWVDGRPAGSADSLSTPHVHDLGTGLAPGPHRLAIRVDNRLVVDVGINSHSVTDHTQGNWNGIVGRIELSATAPVWIDDLQVFPHVAARSATVKGRLGNATGRPGRGSVALRAEPAGAGGTGPVPEVTVGVSWDAAGGDFEAEVPLGAGAPLWDEFSPALHRLTATLDGGPDARTVTFGLREIATRGTQFVLNGRKTFIRGTLECCIFPLTGHPPADVDSWKRIVGIAKAHGLNAIRFHSWCPPEAAFVAADELGFYYHVECGSWANTTTALGKGLPIDRWIHAEADRILRAYGNHPSFLLMPYGNEPAGEDRKFLAAWVNRLKAKDPRRLYTSAAGWPQIPENQFHVTPDPRIQGWGEGLASRINARPPETRTDYRSYIAARSVPVVSHEIGQWCVYPNLDEIAKYRGPLKARNFEIFRDSLAAHGLLDRARDFLAASGKLQALCYKEEIESALRTPGMGGFELLDLHDFPGQGTALVGVLDPFWDGKGYVTAAEFARSCGPTVPLARLEKRVWTTAETFEADLEVAHFGPAPLAGVRTLWKAVDARGVPLAAGALPPRDIPVDNGTALGKVRFDLKDIAAPAACKFLVSLEGTGRENDWDIWIYPPAAGGEAPPPDVLVTADLDAAALAALDAGGKVLLLAPPARVKGDRLGKIAFGFSPIFWNTAWTRRQAPHTLGITCDPAHPALARFPTEAHSNWQWWYVVTRAQPMILDGLPRDLRPIIGVIDDWVTNRRLGLAFEAAAGKGKLLVASIDLGGDLAANPVARQLRDSLFAYVRSDRFRPAVAVAPGAIRALLAEPTALGRLGARATADSEEPGYEAGRAIDGDPATLWHTAWTGGKPDFPHEIRLDFERPARIRGIAVLPRGDGNRNGAIRDYEVYASADGREWGPPAARGSFAADAARKTVTFDAPREAKAIRLVARTGFGPPFAGVAEIDVLPADR